jgi:hypothetical protein
MENVLDLVLGIYVKGIVTVHQVNPVVVSGEVLMVLVLLLVLENRGRRINIVQWIYFVVVLITRNVSKLVLVNHVTRITIVLLDNVVTMIRNVKQEIAT